MISKNFKIFFFVFLPIIKIYSSNIDNNKKEVDETFNDETLKMDNFEDILIFYNEYKKKISSLLAYKEYEIFKESEDNKKKMIENFIKNDEFFYVYEVKKNKDLEDNMKNFIIKAAEENNIDLHVENILQPILGLERGEYMFYNILLNKNSNIFGIEEKLLYLKIPGYEKFKIVPVINIKKPPIQDLTYNDFIVIKENDKGIYPYIKNNNSIELKGIQKIIDKKFQEIFESNKDRQALTDIFDKNIIYFNKMRDLENKIHSMKDKINEYIKISLKNQKNLDNLWFILEDFHFFLEEDMKELDNFKSLPEATKIDLINKIQLYTENEEIRTYLLKVINRKKDTEDKKELNQSKSRKDSINQKSFNLDNKENIPNESTQDSSNIKEYREDNSKNIDSKNFVIEYIETKDKKKVVNEATNKQSIDKTENNNTEEVGNIVNNHSFILEEIQKDRDLKKITHEEKPIQIIDKKDTNKTEKTYNVANDYSFVIEDEKPINVKGITIQPKENIQYVNKAPTNKIEDIQNIEYIDNSLNVENKENIDLKKITNEIKNIQIINKAPTNNIKDINNIDNNLKDSIESESTEASSKRIIDNKKDNIDLSSKEVINNREKIENNSLNVEDKEIKNNGLLTEKKETIINKIENFFKNIFTDKTEKAKNINNEIEKEPKDGENKNSIPPLDIEENSKDITIKNKVENKTNENVSNEDIIENSKDITIKNKVENKTNENIDTKNKNKKEIIVNKTEEDKNINNENSVENNIIINEKEPKDGLDKRSIPPLNIEENTIENSKEIKKLEQKISPRQNTNYQGEEDNYSYTQPQVENTNNNSYIPNQIYNPAIHLVEEQYDYDKKVSPEVTYEEERSVPQVAPIYYNHPTIPFYNPQEEIYPQPEVIYNEYAPMPIIEEAYPKPIYDNPQMELVAEPSYISQEQIYPQPEVNYNKPVYVPEEVVHNQPIYEPQVPEVYYKYGTDKRSIPNQDNRKNIFLELTDNNPQYFSEDIYIPEEEVEQNQTKEKGNMAKNILSFIVPSLISYNITKAAAA